MRLSARFGSWGVYRRRFNIDHLRQLNFDQGLEADVSMVSCG